MLGLPAYEGLDVSLQRVGPYLEELAARGSPHRAVAASI